MVQTTCERGIEVGNLIGQRKVIRQLLERRFGLPSI
jgi:hypothetical protein